jgi:hypothetical protein
MEWRIKHWRPGGVNSAEERSGVYMGGISWPIYRYFQTRI